MTDIDIKNAYSELVPTVNPHWFIRAACHAMEIIGAIVVPIGITADGPGVKYAWLASAMGAALVVIAIFIRESRIR